MSEFIDFEAEDEDCVSSQREEECVERESDNDFIDDNNYNKSVSNYYAFENVERPYNNAMNDTLENFDHDQEPCEMATNAEIDNFDNYGERVDRFKSSLKNPHDLEISESFFYSILYGIRYRLTEKVEYCDDDKMKRDITAEIFDQLNSIEDKLKLDLDLMNFENQCF